MTEANDPKNAHHRRHGIQAVDKNAQEPVSAPAPSAAPDAAGGEASAQAGADSQEDRAAALQKEQKETYDRLLRVTAEFENYKKRMTREMDEFRKYANQSLLKEILTVVDHIELAIQAAASPSGLDKKMVEGLKLTQKELLRILEKFNVTPIAAEGEVFNPERHEAILQEPSDQVPPNTVLREMQKGYLIGGRLLRPALVVVAASAGAEQQPDLNPPS